MECPQCAAHVTEFGPATRQLLLYRRATPRSVHPMAQPGPRFLDRLLGEVANRRRADRRRWLYAVAAAVVFAVAGPGIAIMASGGDVDRTQQVAATDERSGVWAQVTSEDTVWGSQIELKVKDGAGPRACHLVAIANDGTEEPKHDARESTMMGASTLHANQIDKYELRSNDGLHLVTLDLS